MHANPTWKGNRDILRQAGSPLRASLYRSYGRPSYHPAVLSVEARQCPGAGVDPETAQNDLQHGEQERVGRPLCPRVGA